MGSPWALDIEEPIDRYKCPYDPQADSCSPQPQEKIQQNPVIIYQRQKCQSRLYVLQEVVIAQVETYKGKYGTRSGQGDSFQKEWCPDKPVGGTHQFHNVYLLAPGKDS